MMNAQGQLVGSGATDPGQAGVGLFFQQTQETPNKVAVKTLVKGGSAEKEGTVQVGDVLVTVDGKECTNMADLRSHILGEVGTFVLLKFARQDQHGSASAYEVSVCSYAGSLPLPPTPAPCLFLPALPKLTSRCFCAESCVVSVRAAAVAAL